MIGAFRLTVFYLLCTKGFGEVLEVNSVAETDHHDEHHHVMNHLRTYHCSGWSEEPTTIYLTSHNNPVEIVSDSYPFNSNSSEIKCTFDVKAMHGAKVVMTPVDVEVNGGCFDNILTVEDDTQDSPLKYPGLSAMCGQNHLPASTHPVHSSGTVRVSFFRTSNSGPVKFKVQLVASQPEICPNDVSVDHCPDGPCCEGVDCCVLHAGVQPREVTSPNYPLPSQSETICTYTVKSEPGSQISVNFLDIDLHEPDFEDQCHMEYLHLQEYTRTPASLIGSMGKTVCGQTLPNYPGPSVMVSSSNTLEMVFWYGTPVSSRRGRGFRVMISAVNPVCYPMHYDHHYGDYGCQSSCGASLGPVVLTTVPTTTTESTTTTPYVCEGADCTSPTSTTTESTTTTTTTPTTTTPTCVPEPKKIFSIIVVDSLVLPVPGARVEIKSLAGSQTQVSSSHTTNLDGKVELETNVRWDDGNFSVTVTAEGFYNKTLNIPFSCVNEGCNDCYQDWQIDLQTTPREDPIIPEFCPNATGNLYVIDLLTGEQLNALVNVSIRMPGNESEEVVHVMEQQLVGEDGYLNIPLSTNGIYKVSVSHVGYQDQEVEQELSCSADDCPACQLDIPVSMEREEDEVCQDVEMKVHIRDESDGPVEGASVNVYIAGQNAPVNVDGPLVTDASGEVSLVLPMTGEYTISAMAPGQFDLTANKNISCDPQNCELCNPVIRFTVENDFPINNVICNDRDFVTLNISIVDSLTLSSVPSARAWVTLVPADDEDHETENHGDHVIASAVGTDASGRLTLSVTENGEYTVFVTAPTYFNETKTFNLNCDPDSCDECVTELDIGLVQEFCPSTLFTVEVRDEATALPVSEAVVKVFLMSGGRRRPVSNNLVCMAGMTENREQNDCGYYGITEEECLGDGCCWDASIEDVNFCYFPEEWADMVTDLNGMVTVPVSGTGEYVVEISKEGYSSVTYENSVACPAGAGCEACQPMLTVDIPQEFCDETVVMDFRVVDSMNNPVADAAVELILSASNAGASSVDVGGSLFTDAAGEVSPIIYQSGTYMITVAAPDFEAKSIQHIVTNDTCEDQHIPLLVTLDKLDPIISTISPSCEGIEMIITVRDEITNQTLSGAFVDVSSLATASPVAGHVLTDQNGQIRVPISVNGDYQVMVFKDGYNDDTDNFKTISCSTIDHCVCDTSLTVMMDQPRCHEPHPMVLPVTVKDNVTNIPITDALVSLVLINSLSGASMMTVDTPKYTDSLGQVDFTMPVNGQYSLHIEAPGYILKEKTLDIHCSPQHCEACSLSAPVSLNEEFCQDKFLEMVVRNSVNNTLVSGAKVVVSLDTYTGPRVLVDQIIGETGEISVPLVSNGIYHSKVSKPGFVSMERTFQVQMSMDECELIDPVELTPLPPIPPPSCVRLSLAWGAQPQDLDLYSWRVNSENSTDHCLTYYCNGKDPCNGTAFDVDSQNGGLNGSETITYCSTEEYSNMVYIDDLSGRGSSLLSSQARLVITGSSGTEEVVLNPSEAVDAEGKRYWLAGCLATTNQGAFEFTPVNKFTDMEPRLEEPLNCYNRHLLDEVRDEYEPLRNSFADVNVRDATNDSIWMANSMVTLSNAKTSYSLLTDEMGIVRIPLKETGNYTLLAQRDDYIAERMNVVIECETHDGCVKLLTISLLPLEQAPGIEIMMEWEGQTQDLDLHVVQVNSLDTRITCETHANNMDGCKDTRLNHNIRQGGDGASEIVKISNVAANSRFTYMVFAKDSSIAGPGLSTTEQEVTVTVTDGVTANIENMPLGSADTGSEYWFVGCLELVGETFNLQTVSEFSRESPALNNKLYCDSLFKQNNLGTTQPPFCPNVDMSVKVRNGLTNDMVPGAKVSVIRVEDDQEVIITEGSEVNVDGLTAAHVNQNGHYIVKVEAEGFIASEREIVVDCVLTDCDTCKPGAFVPLSPALEAGTLRFSLSWAEKPMDLDLYAYRRNWRDWDQSCETSYRKKTGCNVATLDLDNTRGGNNGAETITLKDVESQQDNVYMILVNNYVASKSAEFKHSEAHVTITNGIVSHNLDLNPADHDAENWWLAGCLRFNGDSYEFMALDVFFDSKPSEEVSDMCLENFGYNAPTTERPWYQFWG